MDLFLVFRKKLKIPIILLDFERINFMNFRNIAIKIHIICNKKMENLQTKGIKIIIYKKERKEKKTYFKAVQFLRGHLLRAILAM